MYAPAHRPLCVQSTEVNQTRGVDPLMLYRSLGRDEGQRELPKWEGW